MKTAVLTSIMVAALSGLVLAAEPAVKSKAPLFATLGLSADGAKGLVLVFDESAGAGYDTLHVLPLGFEGDAQTVTGRVDRREGRMFCQFMPVMLSGKIAQAAGIPDLPSPINLAYNDYGTNYARYNGARANWTVLKTDGKDKWQYSFNGKLVTGSSRDTAPVCSLAPKLALNLTARQMVSKTAKAKADKDTLFVEVGMAPVAGEFSVYCLKNSRATEAAVIIKDSSGTVVKQENATSDKFRFG